MDQNRKTFAVQSIDFDRFMTSKGSGALIFPFTSKTLQSVAQNRQKIFICILQEKKMTYFDILYSRLKA